MSTKLKAKDPKAAEPSKPKLIISGPAGVGKTWFSISFPNVYYMDHEKGANRRHYTDKLKLGGGMYFGQEDGALNPDTVLEQIIALATEKHPYKTVVFDSITKLFQTMIAKEADRLGSKDAFGASKKPAIGWMRRTLPWIDRLDMNVLFIAHETAEYGLNAAGERTQVGVTADVWDKLTYELDLWMQLTKTGNSRMAVVRKSRLLGFPEAERFALDFDSFSERYGKDIIEKPPVPIVLASAEQVAEILRLLELVKIDETTIEKWKAKAGAETWEEFNTEQAAGVIKALNTKINPTETTTK